MQDAYRYLHMTKKNTTQREDPGWIQNKDDFTEDELVKIYEQFVDEFKERDAELKYQRSSPYSRYRE